MAGRRKKEHAHENHERWLLTYADMITLLVAFFIMLYAMSVMNQHKFQQIALSVRSGFGGDMTPKAPSLLDGAGVNSDHLSINPGGSGNGKYQTPVTQSSTLRLKVMPQMSPGGAEGLGGREGLAGPQTAAMDHAAKVINQVIEKRGLENSLRAIVEERGLVVTVLTDKFLFNSGGATIRPQFAWVLDAVARPLRSLPNNVRIEGHTDSLPIHTAQFPSNWELSAARASNVLRYLLDHQDLPPARLSIAGYADTRPIAANDNEQDRARNRRVEIVVLRGRAGD